MKKIFVGAAKAIEFKLGGAVYTLLFNGYTMFALQEEFGADFMPKISKCDEAEFKRICKIANILAECGEVARKKTGLKMREIKEINPRHAAVLIEDASALIESVTTAFSVGFEREIRDESDEIDLILAKIKKDEKVKISEYIRIGNAIRLSVDETLSLNVGTLNDICELHKRTNKKEV